MTEYQCEESALVHRIVWDRALNLPSLSLSLPPKPSKSPPAQTRTAPQVATAPELSLHSPLLLCIIPSHTSPNPNEQVSNGDCMVLAVKLATCLMMDGAPPQQSLLCDFVKQYVTVREHPQACSACPHLSSTHTWHGSRYRSRSRFRQAVRHGERASLGMAPVSAVCMASGYSVDVHTYHPHT